VLSAASRTFSSRGRGWNAEILTSYVLPAQKSDERVPCQTVRQQRHRYQNHDTRHSMTSVTRHFLFWFNNTPSSSVYIYIDYITDTIFWGSNASLRMMTMSFWYKPVAARLMNNTGIRKFRIRKLTGSNYDSKTERYDWGIAMPVSVRSDKNQDSSVHYNKTMQPT
jgi:hypothetical protein